MNKTYHVGDFYNEYSNLDRVGEYPPVDNPIGDHTIAVYTYTDRFYHSTLRFKREEGERGFRWRLTEIYDTYQHKGLVELPTVSKPNPNKDLGQKVVEMIERLSKI